MDHDEQVIVHLVEGVELVVVFVGLEDVIVFSSLEGFGTVEDEEGVEAYDDVADQYPEEDRFWYLHVGMMINNIIDDKY